LSASADAAPRLGQGAELPACIHDALDDGEEVEGRAGETVYPRYRHHIAGDDVFQELQKLAASACAPLAFSR
jgi:hypothetical protein